MPKYPFVVALLTLVCAFDLFLSKQAQSQETEKIVVELAFRMLDPKMLVAAGDKYLQVEKLQIYTRARVLDELKGLKTPSHILDPALQEPAIAQTNASERVRKYILRIVPTTADVSGWGKHFSASSSTGASIQYSAELTRVDSLESVALGNTTVASSGWFSTKPEVFAANLAEQVQNQLASKK